MPKIAIDVGIIIVLSDLRLILGVLKPAVERFEQDPFFHSLII